MRSREPLERLAGFLALWCIAALVLMFMKPYFTTASKPQHGISDPVLALQMAHDLNDVDAVLGDAPSADREVMRIKQYEDFAFIAGYPLLYCVLAMMLWRRDPKRRFMAVCGAIAGLAAAGCDAMENLGILRIVNTPLADTTTSMINAVYYPATIKWDLAFIALLLLSPYFLYDRRRSAKVVGGINALAGLLGIIGLQVSNLVFVPAIPLVGLGLVGTAIVLLLIP